MGNRLAVTSAPIHDLLAQRWSPVAFSERRVSPETLRSLFEAARWAPSCFNEQPWGFIVATKENADEFEKLAGVLMDGNAWARQAPVLLMSVAKLTFALNDKPNPHAWHDVGAATSQLTTQATSMGLHVHPMAGFHADTARMVFGIPADCAPVAMIAVGYHAEVVPDSLRGREEAPRQRKPLEHMVFSGSWGKASSIVGREP